MKFGKHIITVIILGALTASIGYYLYEQKMSRLPVLSLKKHANGGFTFGLDGKPFIVRGVCYNPIPVGKDYEYDFWADPNKPWITDGKLMQDMGVNAVRLYRLGKNRDAVKNVISDLYRKNGIRTFAGHYLGFWDWPPANYANAGFRKNMIAEVVKMVQDFKDEPGIIGWIIGNENNYSFDRNLRAWSSDELDALEDPDERHRQMATIYYSFIDELSVEIKKVDPIRPVIMGVGEVKSLHIAAEVTPNVDVLGMIAYRGATFGNMFREIKQKYNKPVLLTEYGADRFNAYTAEEDEKSQSRFLELQWKDIERNSTIRNDKGNCIGGIIFEWTDEWWKANENLAHTWGIHDKVAQWSHSSYYYDYEAAGHMNINEEWWGIVGLKPRPENLTNTIDKRELKSGYYVMQGLWGKNRNEPDADLLTRTSIDSSKATNSALKNATAKSQAAAVLQPAATSSAASAGQITASSTTPTTNSINASAQSTSLPARTIVPVSAPIPSGVAASAAPVAQTVAVNLAPQANSPVSQPVSVLSNQGGGHSLYRDNEMNLIKGVVYSPFGIGQGPGKPFWNSSFSPWTEDAALLKDMGANAVRIYSDGTHSDVEQEAIRLFNAEGIQTYLGIHFESKSRSALDVQTQALALVQNYKANPGIAAWILGGEDVSGYKLNTSIWPTNADYYKWVNALATEIKKIDPTRLIILNVGSLANTGAASQITPNIDVLGVSLQGNESLGDLFANTTRRYNQAIVVLRLGADRFNNLTIVEAESDQAKIIGNQWTQVLQSSSFRQADGHAIGAFVYEWTDQWWRANQKSPDSWSVQDTDAQSVQQSFEYDYESNSVNNVNDEWWGLIGLEKTADGADDRRIPKSAYYVLMGQWNTPLQSSNSE
ncbi:MAG: hypothetical protein ACI9Y8_002049 [Candidatus Omnitrophota bacterium]|jgi:hypothetical protein